MTGYFPAPLVYTQGGLAHHYGRGFYITSLFLSKVSSLFLKLMLREDPVSDLAVGLEPSAIQCVLQQMLNQEAIRTEPGLNLSKQCVCPYYCPGFSLADTGQR